MFGRPGAWESLKVNWVKDDGDEAVYLCSTPDRHTFEIIISGTAKTTPNLEQKIREWFKHHPPLPKSGTPPTRIPGSHFSSF
jgi:hypothetical protein